jgi:hypothetical protein
VATEDEQPQAQETAAADLTDELAKKYDPERLLKIIAKRAGRGDPLDHSVRQRYEKRYGVDLGHVRVFSGEFAEEFNRQRGAYAVTIGSTGMIMMGNSPDKSIASASGQALLGHELAHVAQQSRHAGGGLHRKASFQDAMPFAEEHEADAEAHEQAVLHEELGGAMHFAQGLNNLADLGVAKAKAGEQLKEQIEQVKKRVLELVGEAARLRDMRNGTARRA